LEVYAEANGAAFEAKDTQVKKLVGEFLVSTLEDLELFNISIGLQGVLFLRVLLGKRGEVFYLRLPGAFLNID